MSFSDEINSSEIERARAGDSVAIAGLFRRHEHRLRLLIRTRVNPRIRARVDEDDVIQESFLEASQNIKRYLDAPEVPFFLWLRQIVKQRLLKVHREHMEFQVRDARREVRLENGKAVGDTSVFLADHLLGNLTSPSQAVIRGETRETLEKALDQISELDREILLLRNFENLSNQETADELGIESSAASKRYLRALLRMEKALSDLGLSYG